MVWYNFYNFYFYSLRKINKKGNFILFNQNFSLKVFKWIHKQFYVHLLSWKISPQLKKSMNLNHFRNQQIEFFCFKRLINNFSSNGKFLKYYNIFIKIFSKLYLLFFLNQFKLQLKHHQLNNLLNILTNLKTNILLLLPSYLIFFIFSQYDILFFSKAIKLNRKQAKRSKKKFKIEYYYILPRKRLWKTLKFWKFYASLIKKRKLVKRILFSLLNLLIEGQKSFLWKYKFRVIKILIKKKKN